MLFAKLGFIQTCLLLPEKLKYIHNLYEYYQQIITNCDKQLVAAFFLNIPISECLM